jgi:hypothetical protein
LFVYVFVVDKYTIHVRNEGELKKAVYNAESGVPIIIVLNRDISLTGSLAIPADRNITLTSNRQNGFYKIIGADAHSTINVNSNGVLKLDGVIVTHVDGAFGCGIHVYGSSVLIMVDGQISGNTDIGGGVWISHPDGIFEMYGGKISNNTGAYGGGVQNRGIFSLFGGVISDNAANSNGGGVNNVGTFVMTGGKISDNTATEDGGGVWNSGTFTMSGGSSTISNNVAHKDGGGVSNWHHFNIVEGTITHNTAEYGGGVCNKSGSTTNASGGTISDNSATHYGNDVYDRPQ